MKKGYQPILAIIVALCVLAVALLVYTASLARPRFAKEDLYLQTLSQEGALPQAGETHWSIAE